MSEVCDARSLHAARALVDGEERLDCWITLAGDRILAVGDAPPPDAQRIELGEVDVIPGLIDVHSDCFEELAHPRPSAELPIEATFVEYDSLIVGWGITTSFLCVNLDDDARKYRTTERARQTVATLQRVAPRLRADHRVHLRIDVTVDSEAPMREIGASALVGMISYMDHTPGAGQFATVEQWREWYGRNSTPEELDALLALRRDGQSRKQTTIQMVAEFAHAIGAVLAAHDDDSEQAVVVAQSLGARISEFPVNEEAARAAIARGLGTVMGAPNARRGRSHVGNFSARDAIANGLLDALTSDYHPPSMLGAAYALAEAGACTWSRAVTLVSEGPARIAQLHDRGRIAPGLRADLVAVERRGAVPMVRQTWIAGRPAFGFEPARAHAEAAPVLAL